MSHDEGSGGAKLSPVVLIGAADDLPALKAASADEEGVWLFADTDAVLASHAITAVKPRVVVLARQFAGTPRGAALVNTIKTDDSLNTCQIRVLTHVSDYALLVKWGAARGGEPSATTVPGDPLPPDYRGSRQAQRFTMAGTVAARLGDAPTTLIDLSKSGAKVVGTTPLRPNQQAQLVMNSGADCVSVCATMAWVSFEPRAGGPPKYRAGLRFTHSDPEALEILCLLHGQPA